MLISGKGQASTNREQSHEVIIHITEDKKYANLDKVSKQDFA